MTTLAAFNLRLWQFGLVFFYAALIDCDASEFLQYADALYELLLNLENWATLLIHDQETQVYANPHCSWDSQFPPPLTQLQHAVIVNVGDTRTS